MEEVKLWIESLERLHDNNILKDNEYFPALRRLEKLLPEFTL